LAKEFSTFEEFWPFYVGEHSKKLTRTFHFIGTTAALGCTAGALLTGNVLLLAAAPVVGYGPAWVSHFFIEKNRPATFRYPLWSLRGDLRMWGLMLTGRMDAEAERLGAAGDAAGLEPSAAEAR
jgi:hypothetical protein